MDPVTADRQTLQDPVPGDGETLINSDAADVGPGIPESHGQSTPDKSHDDGTPDFEALIALLGDNEDKTDADEIIPDAVDDEPSSFGTKYDRMSDEELVEHLRGLSPKQLRAELGNGKAMQSRFQRELQQQRELTRKLEGDMNSLQETVKNQKPAQTADDAPKKLTEQDLFDEDGNLKPGMLSRLIAQEARAMVEPLQEGITARERAEQERQQQEFQQQLIATEKKMMAAFPHLRENPSIMSNVYAHMQQTGNMDMVSAYASLFPRQYAKAVVAFEQNKQKQTNKPTTRPPVTPASGTSRAEAVIPMDDPEKFRDALAQEIAKATGRPLR